MDSSPQHLRIYRSNRMEKLAEALGDVLSEAAADPLAPECVLVPGRGVAQWLSARLAERFGVWSNVLYLYPRNFVSWALDRVLGKPGKALSAIDPERLLWTVFSATQPLHERLLAAGASSVFLELPWSEHAFDAAPRGLGLQVSRFYVERFIAWAVSADRVPR
jgi:exonuclease V gamma subunit